MKISGKTDKGLKRKKNEDTYLVDPDLGLMIVADGMGGHNSGEVASQMATQLCFDQLKRALKTGHVPVFNHVPRNPQFDPRSLLLGDCIKFSNSAVFEAGQRTEENHNMGTTMVAALWLGNKLSIAHVGDSRLYLVRSNDLTLCTVDHSFVQEQLDKGLINAEDAEKSDFKNMLTRSVGISQDVSVDIKEVELSTNDYVLLCSDGLTKMIPDEEILSVFSSYEDPNKITEELINKANKAGGNDNVTVIVAKVEQTPDSWNSLTSRVKNLFVKSDPNQEGGRE